MAKKTSKLACMTFSVATGDSYLWYLCTTVSSASDQDLSVPRSLGTDNPTGLNKQPRQGQVALKRLRILLREVAKGGHAVIGYAFEGVQRKQPLYPLDYVGQ